MFNLSWDGGGTVYNSRSATPICVQVMNCNDSSVESCGIVGYLPKIEVGTDAARSTSNFKSASRHLLQVCIPLCTHMCALMHVYVTFQQTCVGFLLDSLEARSQHGFKCSIGTEQDVLFFPRLGAMTLDSPERVKYFGLRSLRTCGICRLRRGRSVTRRSTRHNPTDLKNLLDTANATVHRRAEISRRKRARDTLSRHGWDYNNRCGLHDKSDKILVRGDTPTAYSGLIQCDVMHTFFINYTDYCLEILSECVPKEKFPFVNKIVQGCHEFRDPITGITHPRVQSVIRMCHLTAERRVRAIFYWAHVLGTKALVVPREVGRHAQVAVATLQLLLIATRGHRAYTQDELRFIFSEIGKQFFTSLECIKKFLETRRMRRAREHHRRRPNDTRPPVPFKRMKRYDMSHMCVK